MIKFNHKLPALNIDGNQNGTYNNEEMVLPCVLTTTSYELGQFMHHLHNIVADERRLIFIDGKVISCLHNWIRDSVHIMKAAKHYEYRLKDFLEFIIENQTKKGFYYELIKQYDDLHWTFVNRDCYKIFKKDNETLVRLEIENDIEYIVVEGAMQYYRATGDLEWIKSILNKLEKGINYVTSDKKRWDKKRGLSKRAFTIDTWDFTSNENSSTDRRIHKNESMSIMHGDNSGIYQAMLFLSFFNEKLNNKSKAKEWKKRADILKCNMFKYLWNGKFFIHQLHINHNGIDDESKRLSLSNVYDINRGVTDYFQAKSIIEEYLKIKKSNVSFAEWFTIYPYYKKFGKVFAENYVNGCISMFTAGELAKASFNNGFEEYGYDIIKRLIKMEQKDNGLYFLYSPKDATPQGGGPSGWGAAGVISAIDEGLAGVVDKDCLYRTIDFSPKFVVTEYKELRYLTGYEVSNVYVDVRYIITDIGLRYDIISEAKHINCHILLPKNKICTKLLVNGKDKKFKTSKINNSNYVDFYLNSKNKISIEIIF